MDATDIITQGAAAAGFAKILVDLTKLILPPTRSLFLPIFAFLFAEASAFLLAATAESVTFNRQQIAITVLVGIGATAGAIAVTATQTKADRVSERLDTALDLPPGSTKTDVDKAIAKADAKADKG